MSFGKMNGFAELIATKNVKDSEGFSTTVDEVLAVLYIFGGNEFCKAVHFSKTHSCHLRSSRSRRFTVFQTC